MWKIIISLVVGGAIGVGGGFAIGIFAYPYIFLADIEGTDIAPDAAEARLVAEGGFIHANTSDPVHYGSGKVSVFEDVVHLNADFEVGPGPAFHVYLVPLDDVTPSDGSRRDHVCRSGVAARVQGRPELPRSRRYRA